MTPPDPAEPWSPALYLRGTPLAPRRLGESLRPRLPHDVWDVASIPAGAYLELVSYAAAVVVVLEVAPTRHPLVFAGMPEAISVWREDESVGSVLVGSAGGPVTVPLAADGGLYRLYLPEGSLARVTALVPLGGRIEPGPRRRRWLAYGDSITQGWSASEPGLTYPAIVGRRCGVDTWNLGFAGTARGETPVAEHLASLSADVISLAFGTNNWVTVPTSAAHLGTIVADFLTVVRSGHPETPIVVLSPIVRPSAETTPNVTGSSLGEMRQALEAAVGDLAAKDPALRLIGGLNVVRENQLADGLHPGDSGHHAIAAVVAPAIREVLDRAGA